MIAPEPPKCSPQTSSASCCQPQPDPPAAEEVTAASDSCCGPQAGRRQLPGYRLEPFVCAWLETSLGPVPQVSSQLSWRDRRGRWAMRWGFGRDRYQLTPGLYAVGHPDAQAPVLVSANYKLSFDCLRTALAGRSAWLLVIDTKGINVWCAAGKGTFGT
ncbi:MAG: mercury methylation corrinoid protein HgcA, partial [Alphaproteobacteria bacterium]|nr:mercury methylation corrinoid protein HgcA [Alphaproteobacteria bacterium]